MAEGHRIAEQARARVLRAHPDVLDVLVHVDPEDDSTPAGRASTGLPDRAILEAEIARLLGPGLRQCAPPTLHYLGSHVDAEVFLAIDQIGDADACAALERRIGKAVEGHPVLGAISIQWRVAPK